MPYRKARRGVFAGPEAPFHLLHNKKEAELSGGALVRHERIDGPSRSRWNPQAESTLGLGYAQAVLAVLHGIVTAIMCSSDARAGRVAMQSTSGWPTYSFSWDDDG